jgi:hypothetical protein
MITILSHQLFHGCLFKTLRRKTIEHMEASKEQMNVFLRQSLIGNAYLICKMDRQDRPVIPQAKWSIQCRATIYSSLSILPDKDGYVDPKLELDAIRMKEDALEAARKRWSENNKLVVH